MSPSVIQTALKNAAANPEIYSPTFSSAKKPPSKVGRLTHEAKKRLDAASKKESAERKIGEDLGKRNFKRGHKNVVRWLDSEQYREYDQEDIISLRDSKSSSSADHISLSSPLDGEVTYFTLEKEFRKIPEDDELKLRNWQMREQAFEDLRRRYVEGELSDKYISAIINNLPMHGQRTSAAEQGIQTEPTTTQPMSSETLISDRLQQDSNRGRVTTQSPMFSSTPHPGSASSFGQGSRDSQNLRRQAARQVQRNTMSPSGAEQSRELRQQRGQDEETAWATQEELIAEEARRERQRTVVFPQTVPTPNTSILTSPVAGKEKQKAALAEGADDVERYKKAWSPPTPRGSARRRHHPRRRRAPEGLNEPESPETGGTILSALWREMEASWRLPDGSLLDNEPPSDASMSAQPTTELNVTPELPRQSSSSGLPAQQDTTAVETLSKAELELLEGLLTKDFPTKSEAQWLYFWMRNRRARDRVEGRPVPFPEDPFPLERTLVPKIMKIPSRKFREGLKAAKREELLSLQENPTPVARPAPTPKLQADDTQAESEPEDSGAQQEEDDKVHGIVNDENGPGWLHEWLASKGYAKPADLHLHPYKGYSVDAPKLQLIRAKNFLSAQDAGNTRGWEKKFDELCQYAKYLYENYKDEDWGYDLFEVINMLQTHRIWERQMFDKPKLNIDINDGKGTIYPGPRRFPYDKEAGLRFKKDYRPPGSPRLKHDRGSLAGKMPGLFIQPHCVEKPPEDAHIDTRAYTKGAAWYREQERKWVEWTKEHAVKEAWAHKLWTKRKALIMPLPPVANFNGPVVNILMDKDMLKTYETIRMYEKLVAKLRRTVWKTAVYGDREVLDNCLKGIESGLEGRTWTSFPPPGPSRKPEDDAREGQQRFPIRPEELEWLDFLTWTAPSDPKPVRGGKQLSVFLKRLETLLANPRSDGVFAKYAKKSLKTPLPGLTDAINFGLKKGDVQKGPKKVYVFDQEEVWKYAGIAQRFGMVRRIKQKGRGEMLRGVGELTVCGLLPEQRIRWGDVLTEEPTQGNDSETTEDDGSDSMSIVSTISTPISIPSSEPDHGDYAKFLPKFSSLRSWVPQNDTDEQDASEKNTTLKFYQILGSRLGLDLRRLRKKLEKSEGAMAQSNAATVHPKHNMVLNNQSFLRDTITFWTDDYNKRTRNNKNPVANGERQTPLFKDIVEIADPESQGRTWLDKDSWDDKEEHQARETVRRGLILEAYRNESNIWPARPGNSSADEPGSKFPLWRREPLWDFGAPEVRGFKIHQLFSINRWPLHLQSGATQEEIKNSGPPVEELPEKQEGPTEREIPYAPTRFLGGDDRTVWMPGNKYWYGATPRQQREIWRRMHLPNVPTWKDKVAEFFGVKRKRDEQADVDEFEAGSLRLPKPKHLPKIVENRNAVERRAKRARLSGQQPHFLPRRHQVPAG